MIRPADSVDFAGLIRPGDLVLCGQGTAEPLTLTRRLVAQKDAIGPFTCFLGATFSDTFAPERSAGIAFRSYGAIGTSAALARAGVLDVLSCHYSALERAFRTGAMRADVVLLQVAPPPPGRSGYSLSLTHDYVALAARHARLVIAEVNPQAPWTHGAALPEERAPDLYVAADAPPQELGAARFGDTEAAIARHVASLVPDGACLQFGVGATPVAALSGLGGHRDLGIHSGVIGDVCVDLIERGAVTNARKPFDRGVTIANTVLGTRRLFDHVHDNPAVAVHPASRTHDHATIAAIPNVRAINSAIEVDLTGQVNSEIAGKNYVGAVGGLVDFVRGALASEGGRSIIALPSTTKDGRTSRISVGIGTVTVARSDADLVVTEHGVADLRGIGLAERARRMIAIAAPEHREALERASRERA
ncbi:acetyl-CoA hydrolase/transferase family protein [Enterovirga rhinocerotis]|uniref:Acyl-CoA hydrolase n=1 Tax=Enterovirga rhinocerotis TaxID=1339210 RepID=A0A4V3DYN8_9HYPH|nr:acetyl-CoA hydrolase/transferase C-terminal domain-containing protein [Enterovirga rhinocerotis]TDR93319.1 acyl-CoA hydrolase [Enterovirga rhinocerotis]